VDLSSQPNFGPSAESEKSNEKMKASFFALLSVALTVTFTLAAPLSALEGFDEIPQLEKRIDRDRFRRTAKPDAYPVRTGRVFRPKLTGNEIRNLPRNEQEFLKMREQIEAFDNRVSGRTSGHSDDALTSLRNQAERLKIAEERFKFLMEDR